MRPYIVRQGDVLSRIAARHGFDAQEVWEDDANRALRELRGSPDVLHPGDVLHIPDPVAPRGTRISSRTTNRYVATLPSLPIRVVVRRGSEVVRNERCEIVSLTPPLEAQTDGDGLLSFEAPYHVEEIRVRFPARSFELLLRVGHLDPIDEESGVVARLENLGFLMPSGMLQGGRVHRPLYTQDAQRVRMARALACFQRQQGLAPTGELDEATRNALRDAHGA